MAKYGVIPEGFNEKTFEVIIGEVEQAQRDAFGPDFDTSPDDVAGIQNGILGDKIAELWEVAGAIYRARQPSSATGEALDEVCGLTGALRLDAASSTVTLFVNLDDGTTLAEGSVAQIGNNGERWLTDEEVSNSLGYQATIQVRAKSETESAIPGNATTVDSIAVPVSGWTAKAALTCQSPEPYFLEDGQTLLVEVDEGTAQTVTFNTGDFGDINNATAAEVAAVIATDLTGATAVDAGGYVRVVSDTEGTGSALKFTGGTGFEALGFQSELIKGFNLDRPARILSEGVELYTLVDGYTLFVKVDQGSTQTVTFNTADFGDISNATAIEVAKVINQDLTGAIAYEIDGQVQIESLLTGVLSRIEITGGTANPVLNFPEGDEQGGTSGDAILGRDIELDEDFRIRREELLRISGAATTEAIRAAVRDLDNVLQALVFENDTDFVDGFGRPEHSIEVVTVGGDDDEIAETIFLTKAAGIQTFKVPGPNGRTSSIEDSQGFFRDINHSKADELPMYVEVDIDVDQATFGGGDQAAGEQQVKEAIKAQGDVLDIGENVIILRLQCAPLGVAGVVDAPTIKVDTTYPPTNTVNIVVADRELATFAVSDIVVNVSFV